MRISKALLDALIKNDPSIKSLDLSERNISDEDIKLLCDALITNTRLIEIQLRNNQITDVGAILLAGNKKIKILSLEGNKLSSDGVIALAENPSIQYLNISLNPNCIDLKSATELASNKTLKTLQLSNNLVSDDSAIKLSESVSLGYVNLQNNLFDNPTKVFEAFAKNNSIHSLSINVWGDINNGLILYANNTSLKYLSLSAGASMTYVNQNPSATNLDKGLTALVSNKNLTTLQLCRFPIEIDAIKAIANSTLQNLRLSFANLNAKKILPLLDNKSLQTLDVSNNVLTNEGASIIALMTNLTGLNLNNTALTDEGISAVAQLPKIKILQIDSNKLEDDSLKLLANNKSLTTLSMSNVAEISKLSSDVLATIIAGSKSIRTLILTKNCIGATGIIALAKNSVIQSLTLSENESIKREGAQALAENTSLKKLTVDKCYLDNSELILLSKNTSILQIQARGNSLLTLSGLKDATIHNKTLISLYVDTDKRDDVLSATQQLDQNQMVKYHKDYLNLQAKRSKLTLSIAALCQPLKKDITVSLVDDTLFNILSYLNPLDYQTNPGWFTVIMTLVIDNMKNRSSQLDSKIEGHSFWQKQASPKFCQTAYYRSISLFGKPVNLYQPNLDLESRKTDIAVFDTLSPFPKELLKKYLLPDDSQTSLGKGLRNASVNNQSDDLMVFLQYVHNINAQDPIAKNTALHHAVAKKHQHCIQLLLAAGANTQIPNAKDTLVINELDDSLIYSFNLMHLRTPKIQKPFIFI